jgi:hypothetical protein
VGSSLLIDFCLASLLFSAVPFSASMPMPSLDPSFWLTCILSNFYLLFWHVDLYICVSWLLTILRTSGPILYVVGCLSCNARGGQGCFFAFFQGMIQTRPTCQLCKWHLLSLVS